ncbi:MAG: putative ABC transport system permease protein [Pseudoalteromonas tetraodonis]|jgi:putative ABC transport system permease protein
MSGILRLTWRYLTFNRAKSLILFVCLTITIFLPLALHQLISYYEAELGERARETPLIIGAKGDRFDLVLASLYFNGKAPAPVTANDLDQLRDTGRAQAIPLFLGFSAQQKPIIGTTTDYFFFRNLSPENGTLPLQLGDAVLGAKAAIDLGLTTGDHLLSDEASLIYIGGSYPLKMPIVGVLRPSGTPDDDAVFVDIKTAWIIAGIGHGHTDLDDPEASGFVSERDETSITANPAVFTYNEITPDNIDSFHFHSERSELPVTAMIAIPNSDKDQTLLKARYSVADKTQLLVPTQIIEELLGIVFQVKRFFDGSFLLVALATLLFLALVILLSLRIRRRERQTMFQIGCDRMTIFWLQVTELAILVALASVAAYTLSQFTLGAISRILG